MKYALARATLLMISLNKEFNPGSQQHQSLVYAKRLSHNDDLDSIIGKDGRDTETSRNQQDSRPVDKQNEEISLDEVSDQTVSAIEAIEEKQQKTQKSKGTKTIFTIQQQISDGPLQPSKYAFIQDTIDDDMNLQLDEKQIDYQQDEDDTLLELGEEDLMDNNDDAAFCSDDDLVFAQLDQQEANESSFLMLEEDPCDSELLFLQDDAVDHSGEFFAAAEDGFAPLGVAYNRVLPAMYAEEDSPNKFTRIVLTTFALEQKNADGSPSGIFKMDQKQTFNASKMIAEKYKNLSGKPLDEFMNQYFTRTWEHFDVNQEGKLDYQDMPAFMKYLVSDQSIDLDA